MSSVASSAPSRRVNVGTHEPLRIDSVPVQADMNGAKPFDKMLVSGQCTGDLYPVGKKTGVVTHYTKIISSLFATIVDEDLPENKILVDKIASKNEMIVKCVKYNQLSPSKTHGENNITLGPPESLFKEDGTREFKEDGANDLFCPTKVDVNGKPRWVVWNPLQSTWLLQEATSGLFPKLFIYVDLLFDDDDPTCLELSYFKSGSVIYICIKAGERTEPGVSFIPANSSALDVSDVSNSWLINANEQYRDNLFKERWLWQHCKPEAPARPARPTTPVNFSPTPASHFTPVRSASSVSDGDASAMSEGSPYIDDGASGEVYRTDEETCNSYTIKRTRGGKENQEHLIDVICLKVVTIVPGGAGAPVQTVTVRKLHNAEGDGVYLLKPGEDDAPLECKYIEFDVQLDKTVCSGETLRGAFIKLGSICTPCFGPSNTMLRHFHHLVDRMPVEDRLRLIMVTHFGLQLDNRKYPETLVPHGSKLYVYSNIALVTQNGIRTVLTHGELGLKYDPNHFAHDKNSPYPTTQHPRIMVGPTDDQLFQLGNLFVHNYLPTNQLNNCTLSFILIAFSVLLNPHYLEITEGRVGDGILNMFPIGWLHSQQGNTGKTFTIQLMEALMGVHTMVAAGGTIAHGFKQIGWQGGLCAINMDDVPQTAELELNKLSRTVAQNGTNGRINTAGTAESSKRIGSINLTANWKPTDGPMLERLVVGKFAPRVELVPENPDNPRAAPDGLLKILNMLAPKILAFELNSGCALKRTIIIKH